MNKFTIEKKDTRIFWVSLLFSWLAERQGFEPWVQLPVQRFSRPSRSTTPASFLIVDLQMQK